MLSLNTWPTNAGTSMYFFCNVAFIFIAHMNLQRKHFIVYNSENFQMSLKETVLFKNVLKMVVWIEKKIQMDEWNNAMLWWMILLNGYK